MSHVRSQCWLNETALYILQRIVADVYRIPTRVFSNIKLQQFTVHRSLDHPLKYLVGYAEAKQPEK